MVAVATILVVDDEPRIVQLVRDYLEHGGFTVLTASDGPAALRTARTGRPDLVVLDLGLPGLDGLDVARSLRREGEVPIIMLTARTEESDKLVGLELGADDYLVKPFSPKELVARVRAVLRRAASTSAGGSEVLRAGDVQVDVPRMRVSVAGRPVNLTPTEFQVLVTLVREPGRVFTRGQLPPAVVARERAVPAGGTGRMGSQAGALRPSRRTGAGALLRADVRLERAGRGAPLGRPRARPTSGSGGGRRSPRAGTVGRL